MQVHLEAQREEVWDVAENGLFISTSVVNGIGTPKIKNSWVENDNKKSCLRQESKKLSTSGPQHEWICSCLSMQNNEENVGYVRTHTRRNYRGKHL